MLTNQSAYFATSVYARIHPDSESKQDSIDFWEMYVLKYQAQLEEITKEDSPEEYTRLSHKLTRTQEDITFWLPHRGTPACL